MSDAHDTEETENDSVRLKTAHDEFIDGIAEAVYKLIFDDMISKVKEEFMYNVEIDYDRADDHDNECVLVFYSDVGSSTVSVIDLGEYYPDPYLIEMLNIAVLPILKNRGFNSKLIKVDDKFLETAGEGSPRLKIIHPSKI